MPTGADRANLVYVDATIHEIQRMGNIGKLISSFELSFLLREHLLYMGIPWFCFGDYNTHVSWLKRY